jgi:cell division protein ZapA (FtsZ GTPase activity inhibitor)
VSIEREVKIMGIPLKVIVEDDQELELNSIVSLANEKYTEAQRKNNNIVDSNRLRAIAIFNIVTELQTIKGEKENNEEKSNKKIKNLIDMMDSLNLPV